MTGPHDPAGRTPEPSYGADEEGDTPLPADGATDDPAAWVHVDKPKEQDAGGNDGMKDA